MLARPAFVVPEPFVGGAVLGAVASASLAVAAGAHLAAFVSHSGEGVPVGGFFIAVGIVQLSAALLHRSPRVRVGIVAGNLSLLVLWAASRTVGLPFGPHAGTAEALGVLDVTAAVAQAAAVAAVLMLPRRHHLRLGAAPAPWLVAMAIAVALAGALLIPAPHGTEHHRGSTATHSQGSAPIATPHPSGKPDKGATLHSRETPSDTDTPLTGGHGDHDEVGRSHDQPHAHP